MKMPWKSIPLLLLPMAIVSCTMPASPPYAMVDPRVMSVQNDGKTARINIGMYDQVHDGQLLYVVRDHKMIGMLTATQVSDYWTECRVTASSKVSQVDMKMSTLSDIRAGDLVVRQFKDVADTGLPRERVPRMVPVPYQPADCATTTPPKQNIQEPVVPRDMMEAWIKAHPPAPGH